MRSQRRAIRYGSQGFVCQIEITALLNIVYASCWRVKQLEVAECRGDRERKQEWGIELRTAESLQTNTFGATGPE